MGLYPKGNEILISCRNAIWRLRNFLDSESGISRCDAVFAPAYMHVTDSVDAHEIVSIDNDVVFANTQYDCLSSLSASNNFDIL